MIILWLGSVEYCKAWEAQKLLAGLRSDGQITDVLLLLTHPPVITMGRAASPSHVLAGAESLGRQGISLVESDRGGDVTFHGPGQLIGYPIVDLTRYGRDLHAYLRRIEGALIDVLTQFGLEGRRFRPNTGVWIRDRKIAAIGIKVARWVSLHGFSLNVEHDLSGFDLIVPCGLRGYRVTSISAETGRSISVCDTLGQVARSFREAFTDTGSDSGLVTLDGLRLAVAGRPLLIDVLETALAV